jgi:hypothetical protein
MTIGRPNERNGEAIRETGRKEVEVEEGQRRGRKGARDEDAKEIIPVEFQRAFYTS